MSAATPRIYRAKFGKDIIVQMDAMYERLSKEGKKKDEEKKDDSVSFTPEELEMMENLIFVCNRQAEPEQSEDIFEWLASFEIGAITGTYGTIMKMWEDNLHQTSTSKKKTVGQ
jgi:hypothetical protein